MDLNLLAREITHMEGKKEQVNIAQVKEVLHCLGVIFSRVGTAETLELTALLVDHGQE